ncbi:C-terminal binding protein [Lacipirellula parvula]|uniref:D-3-phosphoglycerate dehydrogenase n=1 Tax=Lacipirellula parvula TaxID=2650471 RepID=A0A5K7XAI1_9BACT|nr:C-terminal binding protein [Lacipirellula parvula]BBO33720.1 D-3-phosphoglycerate dehydrogenase [Lacipirellula parvula]
MSRLIVTDYTFPTLEVEQRRLTPLGIAVEGVKAGERAELLAKLPTADFVLTQFAKLDAEAIDRMEKARVIVRYGIGVDNVDLEAAKRRGIPVCNVPDYCIDEVADHTLALVLSATRRVVENANFVSGGKWGLPVPVTDMRCLKSMTVGVVGFGRIGREVASRLSNFKCRLLVSDPAAKAADVEEAGCELTSLENLLVNSDLVTLHCPAIPATRHLINFDTLDAMKPGAILVNVARGNIVDTSAMYEALKSGKLGFAALDVFDPEPPAPDHPALALKNVILHSHIASASDEAVLKLRSDAAAIVALCNEGQPLPNIVNGVTGPARFAAMAVS